MSETVTGMDGRIQGKEDLETGVEKLNLQDEGKGLQEKRLKLANLQKKESVSNESPDTTTTQTDSTVPIVEHYPESTTVQPSTMEPPSNPPPQPATLQSTPDTDLSSGQKGETLIRFRRPVLTDDITTLTSTYETLTLSDLQSLDPTWLSDEEEQYTQEDLEELRLAMGEFDEVDEFEEVEADEFEGEEEEADWDVDVDHLEVEGYEDGDYEFDEKV